MRRTTVDDLVREALTRDWPDQQSVVRYVQQHSRFTAPDITSGLQTLQGAGYAECQADTVARMWRRAWPKGRAA